MQVLSYTPNSKVVEVEGRGECNWIAWIPKDLELWHEEEEYRPDNSDCKKQKWILANLAENLFMKRSWITWGRT